MRPSSYATMASGDLRDFHRNSWSMVSRWVLPDCRSTRSKRRWRCSRGAVGAVQEGRPRPRREDCESGGRGCVGVGRGIGDSRERGVPGGAGARLGHGPSAGCAGGESGSGHWRSDLESVRLSVSRQRPWFGGASPNGTCGRRRGGRRRRSGHGSMPAHAAARVTGTCRGEGTAQAACIPAGTGGAEVRGALWEEPWLTGPSHSGFRCGPGTRVRPGRHAVFVAGA